MTKPLLSACFPRFIAVITAGTLASTALVPLAQAKGPAAAPAAGPDQKTRDEARAAYGEGKAAFEKGDYAAAATGFKKANGLIPSPQALYWIAKSLDKAGSADEASAAWQAFVDSPDATKAGQDKVDEAKARLEELKKSPAEVNLDTNPPGAYVSVDGAAQAGQTPMVVKLDPGTHAITISAEGYEEQKLDVTVKSGEKQQQKIELKLAAAPAVAPVPAPAPSPEPAQPAPPPEKKSNVAAYVTLGIAGAGLLAGTWFGIKAMSAKKAYDDLPTNHNADVVERNALVADMAFGVAITLGVTGVVLLTSSGSSDAGKDSALEKLPKKAQINVAPYIGPHGGGAAALVTF